jgi:DNA-binding CsgD family transcriptional regulator
MLKSKLLSYLPPFFNEYPTIFKNESLENMTKAVSDLILNSPTIRYSPGHLTAQERIIIDMMRRQFSVDEISSILTIHPKTVSSHKNNALRKLKIHRLDQLFNKYRLCSVGSGRPYNT